MLPPVSVTASTSSDTAAAVAEIAGALSDCTLVIAFHSVRHDASAVAEGLLRALPGACTLGCTTTGEIGPDGLIEGGVVALGLRRGVRCAARVLDPQAVFARGPGLLEDMAQELGTTTARLDPRRHLLVVLTDGLSLNEERLAASLRFAAPSLRLVGGSAADDLAMRATSVFLNGRVHPSAHLVALLDSELAFEVLNVHHFSPTDERVVITGADPGRRRISEINGRPAVREMARIQGLDPAAVRADPDLLLSQPVQLAFVVGGALYVRSVLGLDGDELVMASAVEEGSVLRVVRGEALTERTRAGVSATLGRLPGPAAGMLLFNCAGRMREAAALGQPEALFEAMVQAPAVGFHTYGEQLDGMHVNHTLTGVVFAH